MSTTMPEALTDAEASLDYPPLFDSPHAKVWLCQMLMTVALPAGDAENNAEYLRTFTGQFLTELFGCSQEDAWPAFRAWNRAVGDLLRAS